MKLPENAAIFPLEPAPAVDRRKSYYGKAHVWIFRPGVVVLLSYGKMVFHVDFNRCIMCRMWDGYSATTQRHVNSFLRRFRIPGGGKAWWDALPVGVDVPLPIEAWRQ